MSFQELSGFIPLVGSVIASVIGVGTLISRKISGQEKELREDMLKILCRSHDIDKRLSIMETYSNLFWDNYKKEAAKVLTHPLHPEVDVFMRIQDKRDLNHDEKTALVGLLQNIIDGEFDVLYGDKDIGIYQTLLARFKTELQAEPIIKEIEKKYSEERDEMEQEHQRKLNRKKRGLKFW